MTTTPNMGLELPDDHGSADQWDVILDAVFRRIDGHDHSQGNGATIAMSQLRVDADISWAFGGSQRAITDLKAIDFSPQTSTAVAGLAGALWLNSADGELYYRTITGSNVKITNGAALNFAAFVGGIGGDYGTVGALEIFDDATDAFWFQQQLATSVRQYAKLRSADLSLYEYKAAGATPAPSFAVTLRSPTALAAPFSVTMPAALPANVQPVTMDATGVLNTGVSFALQTNQSATVSGSGSWKHGTKTIGGNVLATLSNTSAGSVSQTAGSTGMVLANNTIVFYPLPTLPQHFRYVNVSLCFNSAADRNACTSTLFTSSNADPAARTFTTTGFILTPTGTAVSRAASVNLQTTGGQQIWVQITNSLTTPVVVTWAIDYDIP